MKRRRYRPPWGKARAALCEPSRGVSRIPSDRPRSVVHQDVASYLSRVGHVLARRGVRQFLITEGAWRHEDWCRRSLLDAFASCGVERLLICEADDAPARCGYAPASITSPHVPLRIIRGTLRAPTALISAVTNLVDWSRSVGVLTSAQALPTTLHLEHVVRSLRGVMTSEGYLCLMHPLLDSPSIHSETLLAEPERAGGFRDRAELWRALASLDLGSVASTSPWVAQVTGGMGTPQARNPARDQRESGRAR